MPGPYGDLRIEYDQYGVPEVIGDPVVTAELGPGSFWYEVYKKAGYAMSLSNSSYVAFNVSTIAGRGAEFLAAPFYDPANDAITRRVSYSTAQLLQQVDDTIADGSVDPQTYNSIRGMAAGCLDLFVDMREGRVPTPAPFQSGVGPMFPILEPGQAEELFTFENLLFTVTTIKYIGCSNFVYALFNTYNAVGGILNPFSALNFQFAYQFTGGNTQETLDLAYDLMGDCRLRKPQRFTAIGGENPNFGNEVFDPTPCEYQTSIPNAVGPVSPPVANSVNINGQVLTGQQLIDQFTKTIESFRRFRDLPGVPKASFGSSFKTDTGSAVYGGPQNSNVPFNDGAIQLSIKNSRMKYFTPSFFYDFGLYSYGGAFCVQNQQTGYTFSGNLITGSTLGTDVYATFDSSQLEERIEEIKVYNSPSVFAPIYQGPPNYRGFELFSGISPFFGVLRQPKHWMRRLEILSSHKFIINPPNDFNELQTRTLNEFKFIDYGYQSSCCDSSGNYWFINTARWADLPPEYNYDRRLPSDRSKTDVFPGFLQALFPVQVFQGLTATDDDYFLQDMVVEFNNPRGYYLLWNVQSKKGLPYLLASFGADGNPINCVYDYVFQVLSQGPMTFENVQNIIQWTAVQSSGFVMYSPSAVTDNNMLPDQWYLTFRETFHSALQTEGLNVGLTQSEIDKVTTLMSDYHGQTYYAKNPGDIAYGLDIDGRAVISNAWYKRIMMVVIPPVMATNANYINVVRLQDIPQYVTPTQDNPLTPTGYVYFLGQFASIIRAGTNQLFTRYDWLGEAGLTPADLPTLIAQGLFNALEDIASGWNVDPSNPYGTIADPITGRANLDLIEADGRPLHDGWGAQQRPSEVVVTSFIDNNINVATIRRSTRGNGNFVAGSAKQQMVHYKWARTKGTSDILLNKDGLIVPGPRATNMAQEYQTGLLAEKDFLF